MSNPPLLRWTALATLVAALFHGTTAPVAAQASAPERVIIRLASPAGQLREAGTPPLSRGELDQVTRRLVRDHAVVLRGEAGQFGMVFGTVAGSRLAALRNDPAVLSVEADVLTELSDISPSSSPRAAARVRAVADAVADVVPWGVARVGAQLAWGSGLTGAGVKVGIIDSGIDPSHADLTVVGGYDFTTQSGLSSAWADNVASCSGHGTHVAGTVAARQNDAGLIGVAPGAQLYALKVFEHIVLPTNPAGSCASWASNQIAALNWAVANGLKVVNLSIASGTALTAYQDAVNQAAAAGVVVVAAAGNNSGGPITYPAAYDNVMAVGAVTTGDVVAYFSNAGPQMWVTAPGTSILSTAPGGGTATRSGTSMAAPHVAGVAALHLQQNPGWTPAQVRTAIGNGALDLGTAGRDHATGWGLVRAPIGSGPPPTLTLAVTPASRSATAQAGSTTLTDQASVTLNGAGAASAAWSATKRQAWTTLTTGNGTGSGTLAWSRNTAGLVPGTYVDTIAVTVAGATGSPAQVIDTLVITPPPPPLALAVSPASRWATAQAGNAVLAAQGDVLLTGLGSTTAPWVATKRKSWTTLTSGSGNGPGIVAWNRSASGLAPGTYVDTITVTAAGATGSPTRIIDTLVITPAPTPLALAVTPPSRTVLAVTGSAVLSDQGTVSLSGTGAFTTAWTASKRKSWTTLTTGAGTGSGTVAWDRATNGLGPGIYVDTITVSAAGAAGSPARIIDTMVIAAAPVPLVMSVSPASRSAQVQSGQPAPIDSAGVVINGTGAATTAWTASARNPWTTLLVTGGSGSGTLRWTRNTNGLGTGTWVDTITVTSPGIAGSPARIIDSLVITAAPTPVTLAVSPISRRAAITQGTNAPTDSAAVMLNGTDAWLVPWSAVSGAGHVELQQANGIGNGRVRWQRSAAGLGPGTWVDTITVTAVGVTGSARVIDTLVVAAPGVSNLAVSPRSRRVAVHQNGPAPVDQAAVLFTGPGAAQATWTATSSRPWTTLITAAGTGSGTLRWGRSTNGLGPGIYVDTIRITAPNSTGSPSSVIDTLEVLPPTSVLTLELYVRSRLVTVMQGDPALEDSTRVYLDGPGASTVLWSATHTAPWSTLVTLGGTNGGAMVWRRAVPTLAPGTYVDTITVSAPGAANSPMRFLDSLVVMDPGPFVVAVDPRSVRVDRMPGDGGAGGEVEVVITGLGAATAGWVATSRRAWSTIETTTGVGSGRLRWLRRLEGLPPGTFVDTITVSTAQGTAALIDSLVIGGSSEVTALALSRRGGKKRVVRMGSQQTSTGTDSVRVQSTTATGNGGWVAQASGSWIQLETASGALPGQVRWSRLTGGLGEGLHVDSLVIGLAADPSIHTVFVDSVQVVSVASPTAEQAADGLFRGPSALSPDHQAIFDAIGNRNGRYDLGDFLAWVDRGGILISADVRSTLQRAMLEESAADAAGRSRGP